MPFAFECNLQLAHEGKGRKNIEIDFATFEHKGNCNSGNFNEVRFTASQKGAGCIAQTGKKIFSNELLHYLQLEPINFHTKN